MSNIPTYLVGAPGIGKTALAFGLAKNDPAALAFFGVRKAKRKLYYVSVPECDPMELGGAYVERGGVTVHAPSEMTVQAKEQPCVIILDELTAAHRVQRIAALRFADPNSGLHKDTVVVATGNPPEYAAGAGDPLTAPEISRFRIVKRDAEAAIVWLCGQSGDVGKVGMFLRANPRAALAEPEAMTRAVERQEPFAAPRGWHRSAESGLPVDSWADIIGAAGPMQYLQWLESADLPDPVEILAGRSCRVPERADAVLATATAVAELLGSSATEEAVDCAIDWFDAASQDHAGLIICEANKLGARYPKRVKAAADAGKLQVYAKDMADAVRAGRKG